MRFVDFKHYISEATLNPNTWAPSATNRGRNSNYYRNLINLINAGAEIQVTIEKSKANPNTVAKTVIFDKSAAEMLQNIWNPTGSDKGEEATQEQVAQIKQLLLPAADGVNSYRITQIEKTRDIIQLLSSESGEVENSKWWNKGNVAEGIMACAVVTKFEKHGDIIEGKDVFYNVQKLTGTTVDTTAFGKTVQLKIVLGAKDFKALQMSAQQPQEFLQFAKAKEIYRLYMDCATYVNESSNVKDALKKIEEAGKDDVIVVSADGATHEAQHSTKADLWIAVNGKKERLLSIKTATVKHVGAVSGYEFEHISNFFMSTVGFGLPEELRKSFKTVPTHKMSKEERSAIISQVRKYNYDHAVKKAYHYVFKKINDMLKGKTDSGEYNFVTTVAKGVVHHATLGEDIRLVIISPSAKKAYTELEFGPTLFEALENYDLVPVLDIQKNYKILVYGYPKTQKSKRINNDKSMFVQLRSYIQDSAARNVVEIGGLLKDLTDVSKLENTASTMLPDQPTFANVPATPAANKTAVVTPTATATPDAQTTVQPETEPVQPTPPDELAQVKKNAGIPA